MAQEDQPADFKYTHMWVSADGETHLKECAMKGFEMKKFAETEQWVKPTESPTKVLRCELRRPQCLLACQFAVASSLGAKATTAPCRHRPAEALQIGAAA